MLQSHAVWLTSVAVALLSFGLGMQSATAQTTYTFNAIYDILATSRDITPSLAEISVLGESTNAPYGLTQTNSLTYSQTDFTTGEFNSNSNPTTFGLPGLPFGSTTFFGSGSNRLFGTDSSTGLIDFATLTVTSSGTITITGGEGIFTGATGTLTVSQVAPLNLELDVALRGQAAVNGSLLVVPQAVSEPGNVTAVLSIGVIGVGVLLHRRRLGVAG